jgi:hypothetical protein
MMIMYFISRILPFSDALDEYVHPVVGAARRFSTSDAAPWPERDLRELSGVSLPGVRSSATTSISSLVSPR